MPIPPPAEMAVLLRAADKAIVREINSARSVHGLPHLRVSRRLARVARRHSRDMLRCDRLTHDGSDGTPFARRAARAGRYKAFSETLAWAPRGTSSRARTIVRMWLNSPPHRVVLLDGGLRRVGVGRVLGAMGRSPGHAVTADFAS